MLSDKSRTNVNTILFTLCTPSFRNRTLISPCNIIFPYEDDFCDGKYIICKMCHKTFENSLTNINLTLGSNPDLGFLQVENVAFY